VALIEEGVVDVELLGEGISFVVKGGVAKVLVGMSSAAQFSAAGVMFSVISQSVAEFVSMNFFLEMDWLFLTDSLLMHLEMSGLVHPFASYNSIMSLISSAVGDELVQQTASMMDPFGALMINCSVVPVNPLLELNR